MKPVTSAVLGFLVSFTAYGMIGYFWLLYDVQFSLAGVSSTNASSIVASKVQWIATLAFAGAMVTAAAILALEWRSSNLNYSSPRQESVPEPQAHTITVTTRTLLRAGSVISGIISVALGLYVLEAAQFALVGGAGIGINPFLNSTFVLSAMFESTIIGLFAVLLAILGR